MKLVLMIAIAIVLVIGAVAAIGAMLPKRHAVSRSAVFHAGAERLYALVGGTQTWRPDVRSCEMIEQDGERLQSETDSHGQTILYAVEEPAPDRIVRRIATKNLPYGGTWSVTFAAKDGGTQVRITEDGEVYNPIFRFVSKFIMGETATMNAYLKALGKAVGENIRVEN